MVPIPASPWIICGNMSSFVDFSEWIFSFFWYITSWSFIKISWHKLFITSNWCLAHSRHTHTQNGNLTLCHTLVSKIRRKSRSWLSETCKIIFYNVLSPDYVFHYIQLIAWVTSIHTNLYKNTFIIPILWML